MPAIKQVAVLIATYRRAEMLNALLKSVSAQDTTRRVRIVVVDNDTEPSAAEVATRHGVTYVHQPTAGIVVARNTGLDQVETADDAVVFIDDDETATPGWLEAMCTYAESMHADVVTGPVVPRFGPGTRAWVARGGFWNRRRLPTGTTVERVATNNTLLSLAAWRRCGAPRFDMKFNESGGSDTDLFLRLQDAGATCLWCDDAVVEETVPPERATARWLLRRAIRMGNVRARYTRTRVGTAIGGVARLAAGFALTVLDLIVHRGPRAKNFNMLGRGLGMLGALVGKPLLEYKRAEG